MTEDYYYEVLTIKFSEDEVAEIYRVEIPKELNEIVAKENDSFIMELSSLDESRKLSITQLLLKKNLEKLDRIKKNPILFVNVENLIRNFNMVKEFIDKGDISNAFNTIIESTIETSYMYKSSIVSEKKPANANLVYNLLQKYNDKSLVDYKIINGIYDQIELTAIFQAYLNDYLFSVSNFSSKDLFNIYKIFWQAYQDGKFSIDLYETFHFIEQIELINDDEYRIILINQFKLTYSEEELKTVISILMERKHCIREMMWNFLYTQQLKDTNNPIEYDSTSSFLNEYGVSIKEWIGKLNSAAKESISIYTGGEYGLINNFLRTGKIIDSAGQSYSKDRLFELGQSDKQITAALKEQQNNIDYAILTSPKFKNNTIVYRGVGLNAFGLNSESAQEIFNLKGMKYTDKAYTSCDLIKPFETEVVIRIELLSGTPILYINELSLRSKDETEILLPRNIEFLVKDIRYVPESGKYFMEMTNVKKGQEEAYETSLDNKKK